VLAWAPSGTSSVVATDTALVLAAGATPERIPWDLVLRAAWEPGCVEVSWQPTAGARPESVRIGVDEPDPQVLAGVVRERVTASIVVQQHAELVGELGVRLVARRVPGSADLRWSVVFDAGLDPRDPDLRQRATDALAALRGSLGV
jgi:hypothetical protein